jgi:hypothetical protein
LLLPRPLFTRVTLIVSSMISGSLTKALETNSIAKLFPLLNVIEPLTSQPRPRFPGPFLFGP